MVSLSSILRNCISCTVFNHARQTHVQILINGLSHNVTLQTDLLLAYSKGFLSDARKVFDRMLERNMHSWNIMVSAYVHNSMHHNALCVFGEFLNLGLKPDHYSLPPVLKACAGIDDVSLGAALHGIVVKSGLENYVVVGSSVLNLYSKCGNLSDARTIFVELSWKDSAAWNSMILGIAKAGLHLEALDCFRNMLENKSKMDKITVPTLLNICGKLGDITKGKEIHGQVLKNTMLYNDVAIRNSLIDLYSKCGYLSNAEKIFDNTKNPNLVTWTTMISCYGLHGYGDKALHLFDKMIDSGFKPNSVTLTAILSSCSHSGLVDQGKNIFSSIRSSYGLEPSVEHYACVVDLLSRVGCFEEVLELIENMKMVGLVPPASLWGALLAGSMVHRNIEIGEMAAERLFEMEPKNASNYIALCSIYDSRGMWSDSLKVRSKMRKLKLGKSPGCSWTLIAGEMYNFYQGNDTRCIRHMDRESIECIVRTLPLGHTDTYVEF